MSKWKFIFYVSCLLLVLELGQLIYSKRIELFDAGFLVLHALTLVSMFGYIHSKAIGTLWMARRIWYVNVITYLVSTIVLVFLMLLAEPFGDDAMIIVYLAYTFGLFTLVPVFRYAFRSGSMWEAREFDRRSN